MRVSIQEIESICNELSLGNETDKLIEKNIISPVPDYYKKKDPEYNILNFKDREDWKKGRIKGIGGSEVSAIIGCSPYKTNIDLYHEKTGVRSVEDISSLPHVIYGVESEKYIRELFKLDYPEYSVEHRDFQLLQNKKYPFMLASLDGILTEESGRQGILEIKSTTIMNAMQRESWKGQIPQNYYVQVLWYMLVTGFDFVKVCAHIRSTWEGEVSTSIRHYHIERSEVLEDIEMLKREAIEFWVNHVLKGKEPHLRLPMTPLKTV